MILTQPKFFQLPKGSLDVLSSPLDVLWNLLFIDEVGWGLGGKTKEFEQIRYTVFVAFEGQYLYAKLVQI